MLKDSGAAGLAGGALLSPALLSAIWTARTDEASYVRANVLTLVGAAVGRIDPAAPLAKVKETLPLFSGLDSLAPGVPCRCGAWPSWCMSPSPADRRVLGRFYAPMSSPKKTKKKLVLDDVAGGVR